MSEPDFKTIVTARIRPNSPRDSSAQLATNVAADAKRIFAGDLHQIRGLKEQTRDFFILQAAVLDSSLRDVGRGHRHCLPLLAPSAMQQTVPETARRIHAFKQPHGRTNGPARSQ